MARPKSVQPKAAVAKSAAENHRHDQHLPDESAASKRRKVHLGKPSSPPSLKRPCSALHSIPEQRLNIFVTGDGENGELGLGAGLGTFDIARPIKNNNLLAENVGVVQIVVGGMHAAALTHDSRILTWGVNDNGTLGRDTAWDAPLRDADADDSDDSDDSDGGMGKPKKPRIDLNPRESTPTEVPASHFPSGTTFTQVAAGDSVTFAVTQEGRVWGWGTFRNNAGIFGFTHSHTKKQSDAAKQQNTPILIEGLRNIRKVACGANHALALDKKGSVFAWGTGEQCQLGRRILERRKSESLVPRRVALGRSTVVVDVAAGDYHSFAIDDTGRVWAWGLNNYGETGISADLGEDNVAVNPPAIIKTLSDRKIICIKGGAHHSIAVSENGDCLTWGRVDGCQIGIPLQQLQEDDVVHDDRGRPRILRVPTKVTAIEGRVVTATAQSDCCMAVTEDGKAYGWGYAANKQLGLGASEDEWPVATQIKSKAIANEHINGAHAGGQFGILTSVAH